MNFFRYLKSRPLAFFAVAILCVLYFVMIFAEFIAPYSATKTFENNTFHPANIKLTSRGLVAKEAKTISMVNWKYAYVKGAEYEHKVRLFVKGEPYKLFGVIPCERHLFGTVADEGNAASPAREASAENATDQNAAREAASAENAAASSPARDASSAENAASNAASSADPYPAYIFGADNLGRDIFSRIVYGSRISLTIGFVASAASLLLAIILGGAAGYYGGKTDWAVMRFAEFFMLIPSLYLILFLRSLLNSKLSSGTSYIIITLILALVGWPGSARTIRGIVHSVKREEFVLNASLEGIPDLAIIFRYVIPQTLSLLIVSAALGIPGFIMSETTLSYLGLGIADPSVSWGSMINREISTLSNLSRYPWLLCPVWLLLLVTLAFNFLGDALRDFFDPYHAVFPAWKKKRAKENVSGDTFFAETKSHSESNSKFNQSDTAGDLRQVFQNDAAGGAADDLILKVENLFVDFESFSSAKKSQNAVTHAVRGISYFLKRGEVLGIVGESGSGKSVSTTAIPGLLPANATLRGKIFFFESRNANAADKNAGKKGGLESECPPVCAELTRLSQKELRNFRGKKIALILQEPGRSFDPLQNIESVFFELYRNLDPKVTRKASREMAAKILGEVGIPDPQSRLKNYPHQFSGGQLQRIGIALALAQGCELLIADEPTTALDVTIQGQIVELLLSLKKSRGLSVIFISHDIDLVSEISDRIIVMYGGKIMESGEAEKIILSPKNPYTKALLAASPKFGSHYKTSALASIPGKVCDPKNPPQGCPFAPRCGFAVAACQSENYFCPEEK